MTASGPQIVTTGAFDNLRSADVRFFEEAAKLGDVTVLLWSDETIRQLKGKPPKFAESERLYLLQAIRYVRNIRIVHENVSADSLPTSWEQPMDAWAVTESESNEAKKAFCEARGLRYLLITQDFLQGFPIVPIEEPFVPANRKKVLVTGCYDWFHSGHVRFFEEVSQHGDLYVVVGHDANIRALKGSGHPLFPQEERRYLINSVRFVKQALISTGDGWLDADPEIQRLKPDIYAVNEDGDRGGKREYCEARGIEYLVLKRTPAPGLPQRTSTTLRGF